MLRFILKLAAYLQQSKLFDSLRRGVSSSPTAALRNSTLFIQLRREHKHGSRRLHIKRRRQLLTMTPQHGAVFTPRVFDIWIFWPTGAAYTQYKQRKHELYTSADGIHHLEGPI